MTTSIYEDLEKLINIQQVLRNPNRTKKTCKVKGGDNGLEEVAGG